MKLLSMRQQLLRWLLFGIIVSSTMTGILIFQHARGEMDELYDAHLQQLAMLLMHQLDAFDNDQIKPLAPSNTKLKNYWEEENYLIQIWDKSGHLRDFSSPVINLSSNAVPQQPHVGFHQPRLNGESWRIYRADGDHLIIQIAQPEIARRETIVDISIRLLLPLLLQIPLLTLIAWLAVRRGLRPLENLSHAVSQRAPNALSPLNEVSLPPDLKPLVHTLNELLGRLDGALKQQRHFVADAAHELRTPIAALQLQLDLLQRSHTQQDRDLSISALYKGVGRAKHLITQLLLIARSEARQTDDFTATIALEKIGKEALERHLPMARARNIDLGVTRMSADDFDCVPSDIEIVLDNLLSNAIRYTPPGGKVDLAIYRENKKTILEVIDSGVGIPHEERARIFDRFYRVLGLTDDTTPEGSGLGLAIVKTICDRDGATITVDSGPQGLGSHFKICWPK
ncbi:MAG: two-component sensor histidine kinase [Verrucomicrobiaceae bacterium]|nr:two-component sensor histidine kinase [Verrucomicrobiaceae bacterium]